MLIVKGKPCYVPTGSVDYTRGSSIPISSVFFPQIHTRNYCVSCPTWTEQILFGGQYCCPRGPCPRIGSLFSLTILRSHWLREQPLHLFLSTFIFLWGILLTPSTCLFCNPFQLLLSSINWSGRVGSARWKLNTRAVERGKAWRMNDVTRDSKGNAGLKFRKTDILFKLYSCHITHWSYESCIISESAFVLLLITLPKP